MLLKTYKTNQPLILALLPLIAILLWFPAFKSPSTLEIENTTYVFNYFVTKSILVNNLLAIFIILTSAIILNTTINKNEFFHRNIYLSSFLYLLISSSVPNLNTLHPLLFANLFVILAFRRLINIHSQVSCKSEIFDATLFFLIAGSFYPPTFLLIPFSWLALVIFRPFRLKEWLTPFLAFGIFLIYYFSSFLFLVNTPTFAILNTINYSVYVNNSHSILFYSISLISSTSFFLGLYQIHKKRQRSSIRFKKMTNSISTFFAWGLASFILVFSTTISYDFLYLLSIPLIIGMSYFFIYFKKTIVAEVFLIGLTVLIFLNNYLAN